ncbi:MAG: zinc metallopeptidase [Opitutales bacterium]|nr:zinc metallopeptidase [Opitutales bacterium]
MNFLIFIIIPILIGVYAQSKVMSAYGKNIRIPSRRRITGAEAAQKVMEAAGIYDVEIAEIGGELTDHYDPVSRRLALSQKNYRGTSLAAIGVAAHEAGHAIQHKQGYAPLKLRMALIPITNFASRLLPLVIFGGLFLLGGEAGVISMQICVIIYCVLALFQLVTLPVEFDASARAKKQLQTLGIVDSDEIGGVDETLDAAAFTYVAAFITSLGWLLYFLASARRN